MVGRRESFLCAWLLVVGCNDDRSISPFLAPDAAPRIYPTFQPPLPQVPKGRGYALFAPHIVPIVYAGDDPAFVSRIGDFIARLPSNDYWRATVMEYGVGPPTVIAPVVLAGPAPTAIDDAGIQSWLFEQVGAALPPSDGQTIYAIFYPIETSVVVCCGASVQQSCIDFGAYHGEAWGNLGSIPYAVIPRCASYLGQTGIDFVTFAASHELIEAATDPFPRSNPSYNHVDANGRAWAHTSGGAELADLCKLDPDAVYTPPDLGYAVQRSWSNTQAHAGHDPCVPHLEDVYFSAFPMLSGEFPSAGIPMAPGTSTTLDIHLFSDAPTPAPWTLSASEQGSPMIAADPEHLLFFDWDRTTGQDGDILHLTITRRVPTLPSPPDYLSFAILSTLGSKTNVWWSVVSPATSSPTLQPRSPATCQCVNAKPSPGR